MSKMKRKNNANRKTFNKEFFTRGNIGCFFLCIIHLRLQINILKELQS